MAAPSMTAAPRISPEAAYAARELESERKARERMRRVMAAVLAGETREYPPAPKQTPVEHEFSRLSSVVLTLVGPQPCANCGRELPAREWPSGATERDDDAFLTLDARPVAGNTGRKVVGSVTLCRCCAFSETEARKRIRRRARIKSRGNYIWSAEADGRTP